MPQLQFAPLPSRDSVVQRPPLRPADEALARRQSEVHTRRPSLFEAGSQHHSAQTPSTSKTPEEAQPLTFEKRSVTRNTSPVEPARTGLAVPSASRSGIAAAEAVATSKADSVAPRCPATEPMAAPREPKSLLTNALATHGPARLPQASTGSSGILRKDQAGALASPTSKPHPQEACSEGTVVDASSRTAAPPLKTHFVEPPKPQRLHGSPPSRLMPTTNKSPPATIGSARPAKRPAPRTTAVQLHCSEKQEQRLSLTEARVASLGTEAPVLTRSRCLVFQESTDVLERAAERAARLARGEGARNAGGVDGGVAGAAAATATDTAPAASLAAEASRRRGSQHSASSAGEESCSTRSSWFIRGSSPCTSLAASPVESPMHSKPYDDSSATDHDDDGNETPARTPSADKSGVLTLGRASSTPTANGANTGAAPQVRRLAFAPSPQPSLASRRPREGGEAAVSWRAARLARPGPSPSPTSRERSSAALTEVMEQEQEQEQSPSPSPSPLPSPSPAPAGTRSQQEGAPGASKKSLSFTVCPQPERDNGRHQASRSRLSGSPAPTALSYTQRVRGMRGGGPILSPAPPTSAGKFRPSPSVASSTVSASASGYSEDEEDGSDDDDDEEDPDDDSSNLDSDSDAETGDSAGSDSNDLSNEDEADSGSESVLDGAAAEEPDDEVQPTDPEGDPVEGGPPRAEASQGKDSGARSQQQGVFGDARVLGSGAAAPPAAAAAGKAKAWNRSEAALTRERAGGNLDTASDHASPQRSVRGVSLRAGLSSSRTRSPVPRVLPPLVVPGLTSKDSRDFSHPICFLPDTFEDSAPTSPVLSTDAEVLAAEAPNGRTNSVWTSDTGGGPSARRCSWQNAAATTTTTAAPATGATPLSLPFHRGRDRTPASGTTSDVEMAGSQTGWRGPSWMQAHAHATRSPDVPAGASVEGKDFAGPSSLGLTFDGMRSRAHNMGNATSRAMSDYQRAWSSFHRRNSSTATPSPHGSHATSPSRGAPPSSASLLCAGTLSPRSPPTRPAAQRAASAVSQVRCRPSVAQCSTAAVVGATSPPHESALGHLKHYFDQPPRASFGDVSRTSGVTTPASGAQSPVFGGFGGIGGGSGGASAAAARYWNETLSALASAVTGESSAAKGGYRSEPNEFFAHNRSRSVPLDAMADDDAAAATAPPTTCPSPTERAGAAPKLPDDQAAGQRTLSPVPRPIRIASPPAAAWNSDRDGEAVARHAMRPRRRSRSSRRAEARAAKSQGASPPPLEYLRREMGEDGHTRLVVVATDDAEQRERERARTRRTKKKTSTTSMEFNWGRCKIIQPGAAAAEASEARR
ncbi:hypothetical protein ACQY0O_002086 [Thecaphora frezii]